MCRINLNDNMEVRDATTWTCEPLMVEKGGAKPNGKGSGDVWKGRFSRAA